MKTRHKGNRKEQLKRRRKRIQEHPVKPIDEPVELIDGNFSKHPVALCNHYGTFLTVGLMDTHRCKGRQCDKLVMLDGKTDT